jgi:hypothetical protein
VTTGALNKKRSHHSGGAQLLEFFGSMNLAITLLVTVGIASIVGTVPKQNERCQDYTPASAPISVSNSKRARPWSTKASCFQSTWKGASIS